MNFPIYVTRPYRPSKEAFDKLTQEIWDNWWFTNNGPLLQRFAHALSEYLALPGVSLVMNGHVALDIAVKSLGLEGEVITTPFTFASTTHVLVQNRLQPVFCDICEDSLTIDASRIEPLINERTSAILAVHVYGHPCDVGAIADLAARYGLKVIYDAAHAFGVRLNGRSIAEYGDISAFSFHATKLFHSIEGGMLYSADPERMRDFDLIKNFGIESEDLVSRVGGNAKMNEFQAAMGLLMLEEIDRLIREREEITERYRARLAEIDGVTCCVPEARPGFRYNYAYVPVRITSAFPLSRDEVYERLHGYKIYARKYFYPLTNDFACYKERFDADQTPIARKAAGEILALPIYNGLSLNEVDYVCDSLIQIAQRPGSNPTGHL